jgi:hypothetical protein
MKGMKAIVTLGAAALFVATAGCRGGGSGEASGAAPAVAPQSASAPLVPSHGSAGAGLAWVPPRGWVSETPTSAMRRAQYRIPPASGDAEGGECAVFYFGAGQGGEVGANVQRWTAQFEGPDGKTPAARVTEMKAGDRTVTRVEVRGTYRSSGMGAPHGGGSPKPGYMLLGAIVPGGDANWFFKCTGPDRTMEKSRQEFDAMIASVHPGD